MTCAKILLIFQSTPSAWRETSDFKAPLLKMLFQSTPSAWRETVYRPSASVTDRISIHSLRMEGDSRNNVENNKIIISIHSLRMEGDPSKLIEEKAILIFQSTPSAWRETSVPIRRMGTSPISIHSLRMEGDELSQYNFGGIGHFNPLPPHGGRRNLDTGQASIYYFNPLPPHGGRPCSCTYSFIVLEFQSTPSAWRETEDRGI